MAPVVCEPSFICTFCWSPQRPDSRPKVLGREARIACEWCWKSVLDLSICWVCGEMVARGEEVISLGWCFWHRGCFGCLLCGTGLEPPPLDEAEEGGRGGREGDIYLTDCAGVGVEGLRNRKSHVGVELEYIPLCTWCDNATEGMEGKQLLETGLENVTLRDGGLSRSRFELLSKAEEGTDVGAEWQETRTLGSKQGKRDVSVSGTIATRGFKKVTTTGETVEEVDSEGIGGDAGHIPIGEDGNMELSSGYNNSVELNDARISPPIYISVSNVLGEHSFRPSKTKPLPKWMSLLPNNRQQVQNPDSGNSISYSVPGSQSVGLVSSSACTAFTVSRRISDPGSSTMALPKTEEVAFSDDVRSREPQIEASIHSRLPEIRSHYIERKHTPSPFANHEYHSRPSLETRSLFPQIAQATEISASPLHTSNVSISDTPARVASHFLVKDPLTLVVDSGAVREKSLFPSSTERAHYTQKCHPSKTGGVWKRYMARGAEPDLERLKRQRVQKDKPAMSDDDYSGLHRIKGIVQESELDRRDQLRRELMGLFHDKTRGNSYGNGRSSA